MHTNQHFDSLIAVFMNGLDVQDKSGFSGERFAAVQTHKVFGSPMDQPGVRHVLLCGKHSLAHVTLNPTVMDLHVTFQPDKKKNNKLHVGLLSLDLYLEPTTLT
jgi:hypothetical protein